jgi:hypothetical protein
LTAWRQMSERTNSVAYTCIYFVAYWFIATFARVAASHRVKLAKFIVTIGVAIGPGLTALTRILRFFRSTVQERANDRIAALVAL